MGVLRKASQATKRIELGDGDWVEVKEEIAKRDRNRLFSKMPNRPDVEETGFTITEGMQFQSDLFETLVVAWSLDDPCTVENYLDLDPKGTDIIDEKLAEHFQTMLPTKAEAGKA